MEKIETMYPRDESQKGHPVMEPVKPECAWVEAGEGVPTQKLDGTNVKIEGGQLFKRQKPKERDYDNAAYVLCGPANPNDKYLWEAFNNLENKADGIYEAVGPKIQGNPEKYSVHTLVCVVPPSKTLVLSAPRTFEKLREFFVSLSGGLSMEGIVFHHPDGRLAKIKARDFGIKR